MYLKNDGFIEILDGILGDEPFARGLSIISADLQTGQIIIFDKPHYICPAPA